jgi:hypothetical protein
MQPAIGFIVEGYGEFVSYPTLVSRITGVAGLHTPRVLGHGAGGVVRNIREHLDDLISRSLKKGMSS